jgi:putative transposase
MLATRESAALAEKLIADTCARQGIGQGQLTIHADRGSSMTSKPVAFLLADLGITQSHSRPHVSNDNPFSEAQFKTLKYRPYFPRRFASIEHARAHCGNSSAGTTPSTATAASACTPQPTSTTGKPQPSRTHEPTSWPPPTWLTPSASSASPPHRPPCPAHPGSTRPRRKKPPLSKTHQPAPHSG